MKENKGALWQDDSSKDEDGLVDFYVFNGQWEYVGKGKPLMFPYQSKNDTKLDKIE